MDDRPVANARRKMIRDLLGLTVGGAVSMATRPFPVLPTGEDEVRPEDSGEASASLQARLAGKTGLSIHQIDESHLDDLVSGLQTSLRRGETTIRIPREKFLGFLATFAGAKFYQEKYVTLADIQLSKDENGTIFDIVAHASFGRLFVLVKKNPVGEGEVSDFLKLFEAMGMEEGWLVAPGLEGKVVTGEPVRLWENRYVLPVARLMSYDAPFEWLLSPVLLPSVKRTVVSEDEAVVLRLSLDKGREALPPRPGSFPGTPKREAS